MQAATAPDLSMWALFLRADLVVKAVMIGLIVASFVSWAIIFDKILRLRRLFKGADNFEEAFWSGGSLEDLYDRIGPRPPDPMTSIFVAAMREWRRSAAKGLADRESARASLPQRIERVMQVTLGREMEALNRRMGFLASLGSTAPFIGLFGTVWGIMNSFVGIAAAQTTNLAVVAPGIAEALLATAIGLAAAKPAVIVYNAFARSIAGYRLMLADVSAAALRHVSRDLDHGLARADLAPGGRAAS